VEQEAKASLTTAKELAESQQKTSFLQSSSDSASVIKDDGSQAYMYYEVVEFKGCKASSRYLGE
jgi:hypothetical protein